MRTHLDCTFVPCYHGNVPTERMPMRVVFCGSRDWFDEEPIRKLIRELKEDADDDLVTIVTGGARGADSIAHRVAKEEGCNTMIFRAQWDQYGRSAGPRRNQQMLDESEPDHVFAFKIKLESPGTDDCVRRAKKMGIPVTEIYPKGLI